MILVSLWHTFNAACVQCKGQFLCFLPITTFVPFSCLSMIQTLGVHSNDSSSRSSSNPSNERPTARLMISDALSGLLLRIHQPHCSCGLHQAVCKLWNIDLAMICSCANAVHLSTQFCCLFACRLGGTQRQWASTGAYGTCPYTSGC